MSSFVKVVIIPGGETPQTGSARRCQGTKKFPIIWLVRFVETLESPTPSTASPNTEHTSHTMALLNRLHLRHSGRVRTSLRQNQAMHASGNKRVENGTSTPRRVIANVRPITFNLEGDIHGRPYSREAHHNIKVAEIQPSYLSDLRHDSVPAFNRSV